MIPPSNGDSFNERKLTNMKILPMQKTMPYTAHPLMEMHSTREAPDTDANKDKVLMCVHTTAEPQPGAPNTTQIMG